MDIRAVKPVEPRRSRKPSSAGERTATAAPSGEKFTGEPDDLYDAGDLGCGDGPLLQIAARLRRMTPGAVLEVRSTDPGVAADLPAWCRMVGHAYLGNGGPDHPGRYFVRRRDG